MAVEALGAIESNGFGTNITVGSANTKGSYVQLIASSSITAIGVMLICDMAGSTGTFLMDVATGGAGAETDVIANISLTGHNAGDSIARPLHVLNFPLAIASGSRVAVRAQGSTGSETFRVKGWLYADVTNKYHSMTRATTYGANTTDSGGISVDPGATAGTKGSYSEVEDSTANAVDWICVSIGTQANAAMIDAGWMIDIATGAAASETIVIPDIAVRSGTAETLEPSVIGPLPVSFAAGTRIAARAQSSTNDATDRLIDVVVIGLDGTTAASGGASFNAYIR